MPPVRTPAPGPKPKPRGLRVTTGCQTCRRRHVKCDERKPKCANCAKKNRTCEYDLPPNPTNDSETASTPPSVPGSSPGRPDANHVLSPPQLESQASVLTGVISAHGSQELDHLNFSAEPVVQTPAGSPNSPFLGTLGSILLDIEQWDTGERILDAQPRDTSEFTDQLDGLPFHWPVIPVLYVDEQIQLSETEIAIYRNYVENVSKWVDSFSADRPFRRLVSIWALRCPLLLHSCLALSSKQIVLAGKNVGSQILESTPLRYYRSSLKMVRELLLHSQYAQTDEVLAACILLSTYEMIDVAGENLGSHLKGVASLLQARHVQGNMSGIRGAAYWTWYRHEIWAALQTGRRISLNETYWEPEPAENIHLLQVEDIANRVIFIWGQCINFSNGFGSAEGLEPNERLRARHTRAAELQQSLDEWQANMSQFMACFQVEHSGADPSRLSMSLASSFPTIWFVFPQSALAYQVYHASKIVIALYQPDLMPESQRLNTCSSLMVRRQVEKSREQIFLTANAGIPDAWSLVSAQCLYIAGLVTEGIQERKRTLELIDDCQRRTGRKTRVIADELRRHWGQ